MSHHANICLSCIHAWLFLTWTFVFQQVVINDEDIKRQELKVQEARKKLESIMATF